MRRRMVWAGTPVRQTRETAETAPVVAWQTPAARGARQAPVPRADPLERAARGARQARVPQADPLERAARARPTVRPMAQMPPTPALMGTTAMPAMRAR